MSTLKAIFWDVDGTLAETERDGHRVAFNLAFERAGLRWQWDEAHYGHLLNVTGGRERLRADMAQRPDAPSSADERTALVESLHRRKTEIYTALVRDAGLPLRAGVMPLILEAREAGLRQAITTTTSRANVEALLGVHFGADWKRTFEVVVCGEDVAVKKPDPEVFHRALDALGLSPLATVALEDSPGGVAAALAAEVPVVVARSLYFETAIIEGAIAIGPGLHTRAGWRPSLAGPTDGPVTLDDLRAWHADMDSVSQFG
jgi:HAD superfamily hydrolase (TIGR01509 family)